MQTVSWGELARAAQPERVSHDLNALWFGVRHPANMRGVVLLSPLTDLSGAGWSMDFYEERDVMFTSHAHALVVGHYLQHMPVDHPKISLLEGDWSGLSSPRFHVSSSEILSDYSLRAADRAGLQSVDAQAKVWLYFPHVFLIFGMLEEAKKCWAEIASFITEHLAQLPFIPRGTTLICARPSVAHSATPAHSI